MKPFVRFRPAGLDPGLYDAAKTLARGCANSPDLCFGLATRLLRGLADDAHPGRTALDLCEVIAEERSVLLAEEAAMEERQPRRGGRKGFRAGGVPKPCRARGVPP